MIDYINHCKLWLLYSIHHTSPPAAEWSFISRIWKNLTQIQAGHIISTAHIYRGKYQRNWSFSKFWQVLTISNRTEKCRRQKFTEGNTNEIDHFQNSGKFWPFRAKRIGKWKTITDSISEHPYSVKHVDRWIRFGHKNDSKMWWIRFGHMSYSSKEIP